MKEMKLNNSIHPFQAPDSHRGTGEQDSVLQRNGSPGHVWTSSRVAHEVSTIN